MANRVCQKCGEEYSDTYKKCPFCEEEEAIRRGHPLHRQNGGKRLDTRRRSSGGVGGILLLLTFVIVLGVLVYVFWGDRIADTVGIRSDPAELGFGSGDGEEDEEAPPLELDPPEPVSLLTMSQSAMTLSVGETALLTVSGMEGEVVWTSSNEEVATVSGGTVTGMAGGTVTITAEVEGEIATCALEINGAPPEKPDEQDPEQDPDPVPSSTPGENTGTTAPATPSKTELSLNKTDFTLRPEDPATVQMTVNGTSSKVTWTSKDTSVVTVSDSGLVTRVGTGTTTVTASVDGQTLECTVRVK